jgi:hypothetical protein
MLLGVVLLGRALEERAKLRASADMAALQARCFVWGGQGWWSWYLWRACVRLRRAGVYSCQS